MGDRVHVKGLTLTDYFKLRDVEPFEDTIELDCLVGDLITKPQEQFEDKEQIDQKSNDDEQEGNLQQLEENDNMTVSFQEKKQSQPFLSTKNSPKNNNRQSKLSKLSSLQLRSSSIKVYKSDKIRIKQISISPYQRDLSKPKQTFRTLCGQQLNPQMTSNQQYPLLLQYRNNPIDKYYRNAASSLQKQDKMLVNLRQIKKMKQFDLSNNLKKGKLQGVYNVMNAYTKKLRDQQRAKHQL